MNIIIDRHDKALNKQDIDNLFWELNKELRKRIRKLPKGFRANLYVVGGACVVTQLMSRESTTDIDAVWDMGSEMCEAINAVGDKLKIGHTWCNCDFKQTKSYTNAIMTNCKLYKEFDRLNVYMVNLDLLLAMKLVSFRENRTDDVNDIANAIIKLRSTGQNVDFTYLKGIVLKYYNTSDILSDAALNFMRMM